MLCLHSIFEFGRFEGGLDEEIGMGAALLQLHDDVDERHLGAAILHVECLEVAGQDVLVVLSANLL